MVQAPIVVGKRSAVCPPEAIIIGGGTAGLFAAYLLAREGVRVSLFDASERLGPPARTLIITAHLSDILGFVPSQAIINRTPNLLLHSPGRSSASIRLREPDLIVERADLVKLVAEKAAAAGADIYLGYRFAGLETSESGVTLSLEGRNGRMKHVHTRILIGADGAHSQVRQAAGLPNQKMVSLLQARVPLPSWAPIDTTQVWFDPTSTRFFYWLEPESASQATVGLIADNQSQAQASLSHFLAAQHLQPSGYQAAQIPFYHHRAVSRRTCPGAHVFLIGDAAGHIKMTTVGGVVTGLRGARAVAQAILQNGNDGRELEALHRELGLHLLVHQVINRFGPSEYDDLLGLVDSKVKDIMGSHTRDEIGHILFPSLLAQPRFLLLGVRCLLQRPQFWQRAGQH